MSGRDKRKRKTQADGEGDDSKKSPTRDGDSAHTSTSENSPVTGIEFSEDENAENNVGVLRQKTDWQKKRIGDKTKVLPQPPAASKERQTEELTSNQAQSENNPKDVRPSDKSQTASKQTEGNQDNAVGTPKPQEQSSNADTLPNSNGNIVGDSPMAEEDNRQDSQVDGGSGTDTGTDIPSKASDCSSAKEESSHGEHKSKEKVADTKEEECREGRMSEPVLLKNQRWMDPWVYIPVLCSIVALLVSFLVWKSQPTLPNEYKTQISNIRHEIERFQQEIATLPKTCESKHVNEEMEALKNKVKELTKELQEQAIQRDGITADVKNLRSYTDFKLSEVHTEQQNTRKDISSLQITYTDGQQKLENKLEKLSEAFNELKSENTRAKEVVKRLQNDVSQIRSEVDTQIGIHVNNLRTETNTNIKQAADHLGQENQNLQEKIKKLHVNQDIQESQMQDVFSIATKFDPVHLVVAVIFVIQIFLAFHIKKTSNPVSGGTSDSEEMPATHLQRTERKTNILEQVQRQTLQKKLCILSFYETHQRFHHGLMDSVMRTGSSKVYLVTKHEDILNLPACNVFMVFVDYNARHVILEDPSLGLGDLRLTTVQAIQKMGATVLLTYVSDPDSRRLNDGELFNKTLTSITTQRELSALSNKQRVFSVDKEYTDKQKDFIRRDICQQLT